MTKIFCYWRRLGKELPDVVVLALSDEGNIVGLAIADTADDADVKRELLGGDEWWFRINFPDGYTIEWLGECPAPGVHEDFDRAFALNQALK